MKNTVLLFSTRMLICLNFVVPMKCLDELRDEFRRVFSCNDTPIGAVRAVDHYNRGGKWHIVLVVAEEDGNQLYSLVRSFCEARGLIFEEVKEAESALAT